MSTAICGAAGAWARRSSTACASSIVRASRLGTFNCRSVAPTSASADPSAIGCSWRQATRSMRFMSTRRGRSVADANETQGILAIWNSCVPGREAEFEEWYQHEHFYERIAVPGFLLGRRYEAVRGTPQYFCFYLTRSPGVLKSPSYLERLNNPTPQTRKIMAGPFRDMVRTACSLAARFGAMRGAVVVTVRFTKPPALSVLHDTAKDLAADKAVACAEVW